MKMIPFDQLEYEARKATGEEAPFWVKFLFERNIVNGILLVNILLACLNQVIAIICSFSISLSMS
jgi:hypothetical protein